MATIEIYIKPTCGFCHMAKQLLSSKGLSFSEVNISAQPERRAEMIQRANGGSTVPQIFIGGQHVGGRGDLMGGGRTGKLDALLST